jgi:hypothetical protein
MSLMCALKSARLSLLEWVFDLIILPQHHLPLLLRRSMLNPNLLRKITVKFSDESRIPQLARYPQIFTAPHQCIRLAALGCGRYAVGVEVLLLASGYGDQPNHFN